VENRGKEKKDTPGKGRPEKNRARDETKSTVRKSEKMRNVKERETGFGIVIKDSANIERPEKTLKNTHG